MPPGTWRQLNLEGIVPELVRIPVVLRHPDMHGLAAGLFSHRAKGRRAVDFPKPELDKVLGKRVPLFQEQAMQVAMVAAGFSATEADQLRRAMATFYNFTGGVNKFKDKLIQGMIDNGYDIGEPHSQAAWRTTMDAARDIYIPDLHIDTITVKSRDFR